MFSFSYNSYFPNGVNGGWGAVEGVIILPPSDALRVITSSQMAHLASGSMKTPRRRIDTNLSIRTTLSLRAAYSAAWRTDLCNLALLRSSISEDFSPGITLPYGMSLRSWCGLTDPANSDSISDASVWGTLSCLDILWRYFGSVQSSTILVRSY